MHNTINSSALKYNKHGYMCVSRCMENRMEEYTQKIKMEVYGR